MSHWNNLPQLRLGVYPTPFYRLENISRIYNKSIWIKRDDLCGVALGGNKVRKLEYLLADAQKQGCDTVFTTGGAQSNHDVSGGRDDPDRPAGQAGKEAASK